MADLPIGAANANFNRPNLYLSWSGERRFCMGYNGDGTLARQDAHGPHISLAHLLLTILFLFDVVAKQHVLIPKVKFSADNDRVRPAILVAPFRLVEAPFLNESFWAGLDQHHGPFAALSAQIKVAICVSDRTFARKFLLFLPNHVAGF